MTWIMDNRPFLEQLGGMMAALFVLILAVCYSKAITERVFAGIARLRIGERYVSGHGRHATANCWTVGIA